MRRFGRRSGRRRTGRGSRKTRWTGAIFQASNIAFLSGSPATGAPYTWVSSWARWPSAGIDAGSERVVPSDETLVRSIMRTSVSIVEGNTVPFDICMGLIAFDGGHSPEFYDAATFTSNVSFVAPPHPIIDIEDDWILRTPIVSSAASGVAASFLPPDTDLWDMSRAMRKLPPDTGILVVIGINNFLSVGPPLVTLNWTADIRMAIRSGYTA